MLRLALPLLAAVASACLACCVSSPAALPDWQMHPKFERLLAKVGQTVEMKCHPQPKTSFEDVFKKHKTMWTFQKCGKHYSHYPCPEFVEEGRENEPLIFCGKKLCRGNLVLSNVSLANSGMYQCVYPVGNKTSNKRTIVAYILEVIEAAKRPKILEVYPENITVLEGSQVIFSCKALSNVFAEFHWVRKYDNNSTTQTIAYGNDLYESVNSSGQVPMSENTYVGKLILPAVQQKDSRDYACVVANSRGFVYSEAHLTVLPRISQSRIMRQGVDSSVHLLFLIPVIMILVPAIVWLVYVQWRQRKQRENQNLDTASSDLEQNNRKRVDWKQHNNNKCVIKYQIVDSSVENEGTKKIVNKVQK